MRWMAQALKQRSRAFWRSLAPEQAHETQAGFEKNDRQTTRFCNAGTYLKEALDRLEQSSTADYATYASLLRQCSGAKALPEGKRVHAHITNGAYNGDTFLANLLVQMYGKCGSLEDACVVFASIRQPNLYSFTIMFAAYAQNGHLREARDMFEKMPYKDVVSWTAMITAYAQSGHGFEALNIFRMMDLEGLKPDHIAFVSALDACGSLAALPEGKIIHDCLLGGELESDVIVGTSLVTMYGKCKSLWSARSVFDKMPVRNEVSWNAIIAAYGHNGHNKEALKIFRLMDLEGVKQGDVTFTSVLDACGSFAALTDGKLIHAKAIASGFEKDVKVGTALVNMYGKCGSVEGARATFDEMLLRNVVSWTAMISAYAQNGRGKEALKLALQMDLEGMLPNEITFVSLIDACASTAALKEGRLLHESIINNGIPLQLKLGNALVHMYGRCGILEDARSVFENMVTRDVVSWNAMITAYAQNGHGKQALDLFQDMKLDGIKPTEITFVSVLSVCSHAGLLDIGRQCFLAISSDFSMIPTADHHRCMIDLLGRAGRLSEAEDLINSMPFEPDALEWASLLGGCKTHGDVKRGSRVAEHVFELKSEHAGSYVLLSNIWEGGVQAHAVRTCF